MNNRYKGPERREFNGKNIVLDLYTFLGGVVFCVSVFGGGAYYLGTFKTNMEFEMRQKEIEIGRLNNENEKITSEIKSIRKQLNDLNDMIRDLDINITQIYQKLSKK